MPHKPGCVKSVVALERVGPTGEDVLRHLVIHGSLTFGNYNPVLPKGMAGQQTRDILNFCVAQQLVKERQERHPAG